jgi:hypothetical protein
MDFPIVISSSEEYELIVSRGYEPLIDILLFRMDIQLRVQIQHELFGGSSLNKGDVLQGNQKYYHYCWDHKPHFGKCQNCFHPLDFFAATFVSHIQGRGAFAELAYDPRNSNILCFNCHRRWESLTERINMAIYRENLYLINLFKNEYYEYSRRSFAELHYQR